MDRQKADTLRHLIQMQTGISIPISKDYLLDARIAKVMRESGLTDISELVAGLERGDTELCERFVFHATTCHTYFMREREHFDVLVQEAKKLNVDSISIWVAASSTGEEVYSIAICLLLAGITRFRIMASDINRSNLMVLKKGIYTAERLSVLAAEHVTRFFTKIESDETETILYQATVELRSHIVVRKLNLMDLLRFETRFNFIFCRNVFMYFTPTIQARVLGMLLENLEDHGLLFMGQTENLLGLTSNLQSIGTGVFRRKTNHG